MNITIEIPDSLSLNFPNLKKEILMNNALMLFKKSALSIGKASELAGVDIHEFMAACRANDIPVIDYSETELAEELRAFKKNSGCRYFS